LGDAYIRSLKMSTRRDFVAGSVLTASSFALDSNSVAVAASVLTCSDPLSTFYRAVDAFNLRDWATLTSLLDPHVLAHTVHGQRPKQGIYRVINYLKYDVAKEHPLFLLRGFPTVTGCVVTGTACWTDPAPVKVGYRFVFKGNKILTMDAPEQGPC
jgi:hypothetical protein